MAMVVRSNLNALNANRQLGMNNSQVSKSLEKLSSGFRINRAGDDASGLAISEKMKAQIKGLEQASSNSQDGISLVQTAEGAMTEVHNMLNRMTELATKSANGTISDKVDREAIQREVDQLSSEIDRIGDSTNFNGINLLDGNLSSKGTASTTGGVENGKKAVSLGGDVTSSIVSAKGSKATLASVLNAASVGDTITINYTDSDGGAKEIKVTAAATGTAGAVSALRNNKTFADLFETTDGLTITSKAEGAGAAKVTSATNKGTKIDLDTNATLSYAGSEKGAYIKIGADNGANGAQIIDGTTLTIGKKTYEILDDITKVKDGHVAIQRGAGTNADADTLKNLKEQLKADGVDAEFATYTAASDTADDSFVTSGIVNSTATGLVIKDLGQIQGAQKGVAMETTANGVVLENKAATSGIYKIAGAVGLAAKSQTFSLDYLDGEGKKQTLSVSYDATTDRDTNVTNIMNALKGDKKFNEMFDVKVTGAAGAEDLEFTSKVAGSKGAQIVGSTTTDRDTSDVAVIKDVKLDKAATDDRKEIRLSRDLKVGDTITVGDKTFEFATDPSKVKAGNTAVMFKAAATPATGFTAQELKDMTNSLATAISNSGIEATYDPAKGTISVKDDALSADAALGGLTLQVGDTNDDYNKVSVQVDDVRAEGLGVKGLDVSTQESAGKAIDTIKNAINKVSTNRGNLGALQNRLEYAINNLDVTAENMNSANSRIRDTDMAKEMMNYTKMNVLTQSAQAMLAQANQAPQSILQLLQ